MSLDLTPSRRATKPSGGFPTRVLRRILAAIPGTQALILGVTGLHAARAVAITIGALLATWLLPPHERGVMVLGTAIATIATLAAGLGIGSALRARLPTIAETAGRRRLLAAYGWSSLGATMVAGMIAVLVCAVSAPLIDPGLASPAVLAGVAVVAAGYAAMNQVAEPWIAIGRHRTGSAWTTGIAATGVAGMLGAAAVLRSAWFLLLVQGLVSLVTAAALVTLHRGTGLFSLRRPALTEVSYLLRRGARAAGLWLGIGVALRLDRYAIGVVLSPAAVAVYALAATLSAVPALVPNAVGQIALGEVAAGRGQGYAPRAIRHALAYALAAAVVTGGVGWFLIDRFFGPEFADAKTLLLVLLVAEVLLAPFTVASRALIGGEWMGTAAMLGLLAVAAAVVLYSALVPVAGSHGAAWAGVVLYAGLSVLSCALLRRRLRQW